MKRKYLILTSFLMLLYMGPLLLAPSSVGVPILTEQNTGNDFLLAEDPWLDGWDYRKRITFEGATGAGTDYQMFLNVTYDSDMQNDFDDLRFTDENKTKEIDYWIEDYTASTFALVWVEVTGELGWMDDEDIYMYYGNNTVSTTSNGTNTFLFYEDWASEAVDPAKWDTITNDGSISFDDTDADHGSVIKIEGNAGTDVYELRTDSTVITPTSIIGRLKIESTAAASQRTIWGMGSLAAAPLVLLRSIDGSEDFLALDDDSNSDSDVVAAGYFDAYVHLMITRDGTNAKLWKDHVLGYTISCDPDTNANVVINLYVRDSEYDLYCDWTAQRKFVSPEPTIDSWGDKEYKFPPTWVDVGTARFIFPIGWDPIFQFGFDAFFIFLGLIMIPVSTMYLIRGGRKEMSADKLFYGLIIFVVGFGLLVGGIMP